MHAPLLHSVDDLCYRLNPPLLVFVMALLDSGYIESLECGEPGQRKVGFVVVSRHSASLRSSSSSVLTTCFFAFGPPPLPALPLPYESSSPGNGPSLRSSDSGAETQLQARKVRYKRHWNSVGYRLSY